MAEKKARTTTVKETAPSADVQALIEQNNKLTEQYQKALEQINQLTMLVIAGREAGQAESSDERNIRVENVIGYSVAFPVTDPHTGNSRHISLAKLGDFAMLCRAEVREAMEKYPHLFERGYLSAPAHVADSVNAIRDVRAWIEGLANEEIPTRVGAITSLPTLYKVFHWIEDQRFSHVDANGNPIVGATDEQGRALYYKFEEREVEGKLLSVELAVKRRIDALNGAAVVMDK